MCRQLTSIPNRKNAIAQAMGTVSQPTWPAVQKGRMVSQHSRKREVCLQQHVYIVSPRQVIGMWR